MIKFCRAEYGAFWKCVQAGGAYLFTQLCKMLILATFFPATEVSTGLDVVGVCFHWLVATRICIIWCFLASKTFVVVIFHWQIKIVFANTK